MDYINKNLNRLDKYAINTFERVGTNLSIHFAVSELTNFIEEGFQNRIRSLKSVLIITNLFSESFYFNRNQKETNITNLENDYFISGFKSISESENSIELEIITWKNDQPYIENDDTDFIIWKIKAESFQLQWDQFTYF
ncbi:hypothetical protein [Flavobacterium sp. UBA7680]|uniref:hypothetical protein n=1 Tax=Flavobacterium sp. UBA7680 TaxID=1946559 RepID=UPI0025B7CF34|nr:hypothetical protein [Flavobacterium sp. UBA7680]